MKINWLGHACFLLETSQGTKIITDPYESGGYGGAVGYDPINLEADLVTVSHQHSDHNYIQPFKAAKIINQAGSFSIKDVTIEGIVSYHDAQRGSARGENIIFIITTDNLKLVHLGDLGTEDIDYSKFQNIDVALIPVGGTFTLDAKAATRVIEKISPRVAIPMHFKTPKLRFSIDGVDQFIQGKDSETRDSLEISGQTKDNFKKIVVLNHQR